MTVRDLFSKELWESVADELPGTGRRWWKKHQEDLLELGEDEVKDMLRALQHGDTVAAKQKLAAHWIREDRASWEAYRDGVTDQLEGLAAERAARRARIMEALEDLAERVAVLIGAAAKGALGL